MNPPPIPQLDYAPPHPSRGRWFKRTFLAFLVLSNLYFAFDKWGGGLRLQARMLRYQQQCLRFAQPPTRVVLSTNPSQMAFLLSQGYDEPASMGGPNIAHLTFDPTAIDVLHQFDNLSNEIESRSRTPATAIGGIFAAPSDVNQTDPLVYLHKRTSPSGHVRLVGCSASFFLLPKTFAQIEAFAIEPASVFGLRRKCELAQAAAPLRLKQATDYGWIQLFAGQADPTNPARFTIQYETPEGHGDVEGILMDDDAVQLRIADGPLAAPANIPTQANASSEIRSHRQ